MLRDSIIIIDQYVTIALDMAQCKHAPHACPQICANRVLRSIHGREALFAALSGFGCCTATVRRGVAVVSAMGRVVVFSITGCPHCRRVKSLLAKKGAPYHDVNLDEFPSRRAEMVAASGGKKTVPQVFLNGLHVGGNADVEAADAAGRLDAMLETALTEPDADGAPLTSEQYVVVPALQCASAVLLLRAVIRCALQVCREAWSPRGESGGE